MILSPHLGFFQNGDYRAYTPDTWSDALMRSAQAPALLSIGLTETNINGLNMAQDNSTCSGH